MTNASAETRSVTVERDLPHPPEKVWRALTQPHLIAEWLMANDFAPSIGHRFRLTADWGGIDCEVVENEPYTRLVYTWVSSGLDSVVVWTLTPTDAGTRLRMAQSGFRTDQKQALMGATAGWPRFLDNLEQALARTP